MAFFHDVVNCLLWFTAHTGSTVHQTPALHRVIEAAQASPHWFRVVCCLWGRSSPVSCLRLGGAMPDRIGNWLTGVDFKHPEIIHVVLLRVESSFFV